MASTYSDLKIELIGTGDQSGTWGSTTNNNLGNDVLGAAIAGSADVTFSSADVTVTLTDSIAAQTARNLRLNLTGTTGGARNLILGSGCQIEKPYLINNGTVDTITVKNTTGTGIAVPAGKSMWVYNNGTNVVDAVTHLTSLTLGSALPIASGGTGSTSTTFVNLATNVTGDLPFSNLAQGSALSVLGVTGNATADVASIAAGTDNQVLRRSGTSVAFGAVNLASTDAVTGTLPAGNGGTGITSLGSGVATWLGTPSSANLAAAVTDETGSGLLVFATSPTLTTPDIGVATATSVNKVTITAPASSATLTIANGKTLTANNSIALTGTDSTTMTFPSTNATIARTDSAQTFTGAQTFSTAIAVGSGGTGLTTGTSGGVPYFSASTTIASSAALAANALVIGGGAGVAPSTTTTGTGVVTAIGNNTNAASGLAVLNASGNLNVAQGGTGAGTFTTNNVLLGNGTSAFQVVAPGTSGNVLTSDGTTWTSSTPAGGALTNNTRQAVTSAATTTINLNSGNVIDLTMAASIATLSFTNVPASGTPILIQIVVKNASDGTAYTIAWPNSVYWSGQYAAATVATAQTAPTLASGANGVTVIALLTTDGGTKWRGWVEATIPGGASGSIYMWGFNGGGQLGQGNTTTASSPVQVGALTNWVLASAAASFCAAIKTDGTLWTWGGGTSGELGLGVAFSYNSPKQVGALTNWSKVSGGNNFCVAIKTDGTLWSWGAGLLGRLGQGNQNNLSSPVQVGALTNWASVSSGHSFAAAIKTDGTLWLWGTGSNGELAQGNTVSASSPVQVGALTSWASVSAGRYFCGAIKTDGTLWMWGYNGYGRLGQNNTINASSPVQVGALTDWSKVSTSFPFCAAIKTNGTLWSWGNNNFGALGQNNTVTQSSPVQVGALTNWSKVSAGSVFCTAIKTDGTLWSWGQGSYGRLGQNSTANLSSPVQIGASTTWLSISAAVSEADAAAISGTAVNPA